MRWFYVSLVSAGSILLPLFASFARWDRVKQHYLPLLILILVAFGNELLSIYNVYVHTSNAINSNIYVLIEFLLLNWLFRLFPKAMHNTVISGIMLFGMAVWCIDNFVINQIQVNNSLFRMFSSLWLVFLSVNVISHNLLIEHAGNTSLQEVFLSVGLLIFHGYKTFVEAFHVFPLSSQTSAFYALLWSILGLVNIVSNILFMIAILCLPPKRKYIIHW